MLVAEEEQMVKSGKSFIRLNKNCYVNVELALKLFDLSFAFLRQLIHLFSLIHLTRGFCALHFFRFRKGNMRLLCVSMRWVNGLNKISWRPTAWPSLVCVFWEYPGYSWRSTASQSPWMASRCTHTRAVTRAASLYIDLPYQAAWAS